MTHPLCQGIPEISTLPWFTLFTPLVCLLTIRAIRDLVDDIVRRDGVGAGQRQVGPPDSWVRWEEGPHWWAEGSPGGLCCPLCPVATGAGASVPSAGHPSVHTGSLQETALFLLPTPSPGQGHWTSTAGFGLSSRAPVSVLLPERHERNRCCSDLSPSAQGRHRSDKIVNNRPCQILMGKR